MKKVFLVFFAISLVMSQLAIALEQKTSQEIVNSLFLTFYPSHIDKNSAAILVSEAQKQALAAGVNEKIVFNELIRQVNCKISYYQNLIDHPRKGYITSAQWFGGTCLLTVATYWLYRQAFCRQKEIKEELCLLGAENVRTKQVFSGVEARARVPFYNEAETSSLLYQLAFIEVTKRENIFMTGVFGLGVVGCGMQIIDTLLDTLYAKTYHKKYSELKSDLEGVLLTV